MSTGLVERPVFVVGAGRSGTTLLRNMLSAHSSISITPEMHYLRRMARFGGLERPAPENFDSFWRRYIENVRFRDLGVDPRRCLELVDAQGERTFRNVYVAVLAAYQERVGKPRVGDKTPGNVFFVPTLLDWFPDARVIVVRRDPRAVVASKLKSPWVTSNISPLSLRRGLLASSRTAAVIWEAERWRHIYGELVPSAERDERTLTVSYEALVADPVLELTRLSAFLDEDFEGAMVTGREVAGIPAAAATYEKIEMWRREHEKAALSPVNAASLEKWKSELSPFEVATVESCAEDAMRLSGYTPVTSGLSRRAVRPLVKALRPVGAAEGHARDALRAGRARVHSMTRRTAPRTGDTGTRET